MRATRPIVVPPSAAPLRREVGAQAWAALELFVAAADETAPATVVMSVRALALELGVSKNTAGRAVARLAAAGLIAALQDRGSNGRFDTGRYELRIRPHVIAFDLSERVEHAAPGETSPSPTRGVPTRRRGQQTAQLSLLDAG